MKAIEITPQFLKKQRLASGLNQMSIAKKAGTTQAFVSQLECKPSVSAERLLRVLEAYGLEVITKGKCVYSADDIEIYQRKIHYLETKVDIYENLIKELTR
jgi:transcriptional regulator with XRE-family HTH domain